jgi:transcription elongation factor Elf1
MAERKEEKKWYVCPHCGKNLLKYNPQMAKSERVYLKCKNCKEEVEIKID